MPFRLYSADLPNWSAIQSRVAIRSPQTTFVYSLSASRYGQYVSLVAFSDDGCSFAAAAAIKTGRDVPEEVRRPLRATRWDQVAGKLAALSPVIAHHRREIETWIEHVRPPVVPELVSLDGPEAHVLPLLRNALGLSGTKLKEMLGKAKLMRVNPTQYHALAYWAPRFPRVTVTVEVHDARV